MSERRLIEATQEDRLLFVDQRITDARIRVGCCPEASDAFRESVFERCDIEIVKPEATMAIGCRFIDCRFWSNVKVSMGMIFRQNYWEQCVFEGNWEGSQFGLWEEEDFGPCPWGNVALRNCDFSKATIAGCAFWKLDIATTKFPLWPHFTILNPAQNYEKWMAASLPFKVRAFFAHDDPSNSAVSYHWPTLIKWYKQAMPNPPEAEEVRAALSKLDFVIL
jgi:hypothetical protein